MKIDLNSPLSGAFGPDSSRASQGASKNGKVQTGPDRVRLASGEKNVEDLKAKLAGGPEVRQERVQALRDAIAKGSYTVDPGDVAAAMLADSLQTLRR